MNQTLYALDRAIEILRRNDARIKKAMRDRTARREAVIKDALSRWVSELEPQFVFDCYGSFVGLTHAGQEFGGYPPIHVPARPL